MNEINVIHLWADDPPLLEELEIDIEKIKLKFLAILTQRGFKENDKAPTTKELSWAVSIFTQSKKSINKHLIMGSDLHV